MHIPQGANIFVGSKYNKLLVLPTSPPLQPISIGGGSKTPITSIFSSNSLLVNQHSSCLFANERELFSLVNLNSEQAKETEDNQINHQSMKISELPNSCGLPIKIIGCAADSQHYFMGTNAGQIFYNKANTNDKARGPQGDPIKLNNANLNQYPNAKSSYKKCITDSKCQKIAMVGRGLLPFVIDIAKGAISWKGKNVTNDYLDLEVPIDDVDGSFFSYDKLVVANAEKRIRIYDIKSGRKKPVSDYNLKTITEKSKLTVLKLWESDEDYLYLANGEGGVYEADMRKDCQIVGKFKGTTTSVHSIQITDNYLMACSLDGYVRTFNRKDKTIVSKNYFNVSPSCMALSNNYEQQFEAYLEKQKQKEQNCAQKIVTRKRSRKYMNREQNQEKDKGPTKMRKTVKQLRSRNKVGLWYLKPENIGEFPDPSVKLQLKAEQGVKKEEFEENEESSSLI